jgi:hypothetical protein
MIFRVDHSLTLKMETVGYSETLVPVYQTIKVTYQKTVIFTAAGVRISSRVRCVCSWEQSAKENVWTREKEGDVTVTNILSSHGIL